jgi:hypothetical protein
LERKDTALAGWRYVFVGQSFICHSGGMYEETDSPWEAGWRDPFSPKMKTNKEAGLTSQCCAPTMFAAVTKRFEYHLFSDIQFCDLRLCGHRSFW